MGDQARGGATPRATSATVVGKKLVAIVAISTLAVIGLAAPSAIGAASTPTPAGQVPSPTVDGHAGSYAWGAATMPDGSVIVGDYWNGRVLHYAQNGASLGVLFDMTEGGPVGANTTPYGLAVDANGVVYVGTYYLQPKIPSVIERWAPNESGAYREIAPISHGGFQYPSRVAVANDGRVYVADMYANKIFVFNSAGGFLFSWGSKGTAAGQFNNPRGIAFDQSDPQRLYVADAINKRVQVFNTSGDFLFQFGQTGTTTTGKMGINLRGLAVDDARNAVYVVDISGNVVRTYQLNGTWRYNIGGAGGLTQTTCCSTPGGKFSNGGREITVAGDGNIWVGDMPNYRVQVFAPDGQYLFSRPDPPQYAADGGFNAPRGVGVDANGNVIVADTYNQRIQKFDASGAWQWTIGVRGNATGYFLNYPGAVSADPTDGSIVVADTQNNQIKKFSAAGVFMWQKGRNAGSGQGQFSTPAGVAVAPNGDVYVADTRNKRVQVLDGDTGAYITQFGSANLTTPTGIVVDPDTGNVFVTDPGRQAIQGFTSNGAFIHSYANTQMKRPYGVAVDGTRVFAVDRGKSKLFVFNKDTASFIGSYGSLGSGPNQLRDPQSMAYHDGKLYISDVQNDRIAIWCVDTACAT